MLLLGGKLLGPWKAPRTVESSSAGRDPLLLRGNCTDNGRTLRLSVHVARERHAPPRNDCFRNDTPAEHRCRLSPLQKTGSRLKMDRRERGGTQRNCCHPEERSDEDLLFRAYGKADSSLRSE